ncbi:hypothetical protein [Phormidesmis priestleyi]|uniref:hypothetical protein n=1 Tax=Phormidesmis priestleyi TaxID=268141 RepID=UPI00083B8099|nr:hypothetical protein [Phormidesmis priestleyi]
MSQKLPRLTLISSASPICDLPAAIEQISQQCGTRFEVVPLLLHQMNGNNVQEILEIISQSQAVLFDLRGNPEGAIGLIQRALVETQGKEIAFIPVFGGGAGVMAMTRMKPSR